MKTFAIAAALILSAAPLVAQAADKPVIIGYLPAFKGPMMAHVEAVNLAQLTHLNLAFINPDPDGTVVKGGQMSCMDTHGGPIVQTADIGAIVARAHAAKVKVLASLGGGQLPLCAGNWTALLAPDKRSLLVGHLVQMVDDLGLDGLDIDLEWNVLTAIDQAGEYTPFIKDLNKALKARGKILTCATASHPGGMVPEASVRYFTYINIMAYDFIGNGWGTAGDEHSSLDQAKADIATWQRMGAKKSQIVLGVPFYGYGFNGYNPGYNFRDIVAIFGESAAENDVVGTRCAGCQYITYNGRPTIRAKTELAKSAGTGVMIWELTADAPAPDSLLQAVYESLNPQVAQ